jgi:murein tripeptide amidase MpaA
VLLILLAAITVSAGFEGGSAGRVEEVSPAHLRIAVQGQADQNNRNRQANWYYFKLANLPRSEVRIDLTDLVGEYNYRPGSHAVTPSTRPVYSYDGETWTHFTDRQVSWDESRIELTLRFRPERSSMWIAHVAPYTRQHLERLLGSFRGDPDVQVESAGKSVRGRDIPLLTVTDPSVPAERKKVVWVMARQHAWETGTSWAVEGALRFLLSDQGRPIRRTVIFRLFPMADPDGVASGAVRFNANGYDLNRNWDAVDPATMPEIAAQQKALASGRIDLFLAMHNQEANDYIAGPPGPLRDRLQSLLEANTAFYSPKGARDAGQSTTPGMKGRMAVYQWLWNERRVLAFLMEQGVERSPRLGRPPTAADRIEFGAALARVLAEAVTASSAP